MNENSNTFNVDLSVLVKLSTVNPQCWFNKEYIINTKGSEVALKYEPENQIFDKEFGIHKLNSFNSILSVFDGGKFSFENNDIILTNKDNTASSNYRTSAAAAMEEKITSNNRANNMFNMCSKMIDDGVYYKFTVAEDVIKEFKKMSSLLKEGDDKAYLNFNKDADNDDIYLSVTSKGSDNRYNQKFVGENNGNIGKIKGKFPIDNVIISDWDFYIFDNQSVTMENEAGQSNTVKIKDVLIYGINKQDDVKTILTFTLI